MQRNALAMFCVVLALRQRESRLSISGSGIGIILKSKRHPSSTHTALSVQYDALSLPSASRHSQHATQTQTQTIPLPSLPFPSRINGQNSYYCIIPYITQPCRVTLDRTAQKTPFPSSPLPLPHARRSLPWAGHCKHHHHHHRQCWDACCISPETVVSDMTRQTSATSRQGPFDAAGRHEASARRRFVSRPCLATPRCVLRFPSAVCSLLISSHLISIIIGPRRALLVVRSCFVFVGHPSLPSLPPQPNRTAMPRCTSPPPIDLSRPSSPPCSPLLRPPCVDGARVLPPSLPSQCETASRARAQVRGWMCVWRRYADFCIAPPRDVGAGGREGQRRRWG